MNRTLITLATYNELENLPDLVDAILQIAPDVDILVIDDNSPDGTGRWCDEMGRSASRGCTVCIVRGKLGLGTATIAGMQLRPRTGLRASAQYGCRNQPPSAAFAGHSGRHG